MFRVFRVFRVFLKCWKAQNTRRLEVEHLLNQDDTQRVPNANCVPSFRVSSPVLTCRPALQVVTFGRGTAAITMGRWG